MSIKNKLYSQATIYYAFKRAVEQYGTFHSEKERVNIVGIRGLMAKLESNGKYILNSHDLWFNPEMYPFHLGFNVKVTKDYVASTSNTISDIEISDLNITGNNIWTEPITVYINNIAKKAKIVNKSTLRFNPPINFNVSKGTDIIYYGYQADSYDDTIAVAYKKDGKYLIKLYPATTERGDDEKRSTYTSYYSVILSDSIQYEYRLGLKHQGKYFALKPKNSQTGGYKWSARQYLCDTARSDILVDGINIHYGENKVDPTTWSLGCQVIHHEHNFKDFMEFFGYKDIVKGDLLEDEEVDKDKVKDTNNPFYTLINVDDFEKFLASIYVPIEKTINLSTEQLDAYYNNNNESINYYPITAYGWWHNGIHLSGNQNDEIYAFASGKIIYVSISRESDPEYGSPNFILIEHEMTIDDQKIQFYSMYMHLQKIEIEINLDVSKQIPDWIKNKFYDNVNNISVGMKGVVTKTYTNTDGSRASLTLFDKPDGNSKRIEELYIGDTFEVLENPQGDFVKVRTADENDGYLFYKKNSISCKRLHKWAIDSNGQIKDSIFKVPRSFSDPIDVYAGDVIGFMGEGLEHVEVINHSQTKKELKNILHFEIFSRSQHNNGNDIYEYLNQKPDSYFVIEDKDDDVIAEPSREKMKIFETLQETDPNFVDYLQNTFPEAFQEKQSRYIFWNKIVLKDEEVQKYMDKFQSQFRDCVSKHISTWQAIGNKVTYFKSEPDLLEGLDAFHLFKSNNILDNNERLYFYHPIKFIEIIHTLLNPKQESTEHAAAPVVKEDNDCIKRLKEKEIVNDQNFRHDDPVKRCEFLKMLLVALDYAIPPKESITSHFSDVRKEDWFAPYIYLANLCKIAQGYTDKNGKRTGKFGALDNTTIDQALIMAAAAKYGHFDRKKTNYEIDGKKSGSDLVSREQAAILICQLLDDNETEEHVSNRRDTLIRRVSGPFQTEVDQTIIYTIIQYAQQNPSQDEKKQIHWIVKDENTDKEIDSFIDHGETLQYTVTDKLDNLTIRVIAYTNKQSLESSVVTIIVDPNKITLEQLQQIFPGASTEKLESIRDTFNEAYDNFFLDTPLRKAHFFAQVKEEVDASISTLTENLNYAATALPKHFSVYRKKDEKGKFIVDKEGNYSPNDLAYEHGRSEKNNQTADQKAIANNAYANRNGNGDVASGDGWKYRGKGLIQLTGKSNYETINQEIQTRYPESGIDIIENEDDITSISGAMISAMAFWSNKNMHTTADKGSADSNVDEVTNIVNSGTDSKADRREHFKITKKVFDVD